MNPRQPGDGLDLPLKIDSYRIEARLGSGGMGIVYRAFDEVLQRPLAVKQLLADPAHPTASQRFRREARAAARLNHPAVVHIYDIVETEEGDWIVMELVEGTPLSRRLRDGALDLPQAVRLAREIAEGLAEAHAHGIIHRDLKASNVMVTASGHAKVLDFGLAKFMHSRTDESADLSRPGAILGTCHAMSPEQAQGGPLDPRSDLFSFGSLVYEMLTGTSPFRGETLVETLARICTLQQPPACWVRPEVPRDLSDLIDRLLCKSPDQRPASAGEVATLLAAWETAGLFQRRSGREATSAEPEESTLRGEDFVKRPERSEQTPGPVSRPSRERRQVTVVCCELVGVAGPSGPPQMLDPEALAELMEPLSASIDEVTRRWDGHLGSILGHRILVYFGYPQAHEDNARRAVRAALELVDQVAQMSADSDWGRPVSLAIRVGIHTGPAVVAVAAQAREPVTLGATLDVAVELQSLAAPGCVVVSPATRSLIERSFVLQALPPVEVPGTAAPLAAHRVLEPVQSPDDSSVRLLPQVGREPETELLLSRWSLAREGNGQAVLISGEAGIGKSRLVRALRERLEPGAGQWESCFGSPFAQSSPLQPVITLLRQILLLEDGPSLERLESSLRDVALLHAVPLFAPLLDVQLDGRYPALNLSPERQREKTLEALVALVLTMAERQPLVLLIEDLHWLDPTTRDWLDSLIDQVSSAPLLLLMTLRLQAAEAPWEPRTHLTRINLIPLRESEAERLIERVAGEQPLPAAVRRQIVARTDGIPLFLEELTKAILESSESGAQELPATLRDSLAARLERLGTAKQVAQVASVIGRTFTFELLAAVCSLEAEALQRELRRLVQAELVYRKGFGAQARYLFKHALVQDAAYESLLRRERQQIHRRIAEALEARFSETAETTPEILAHHYTEAGLTVPAIDFWVRAGAVASRRTASSEALSHLDCALRLLQGLEEGPERDRRELKIQNARAAAILTKRGYAAPEVEQTYTRAEILAERLGEAEERFWAVHGLQTHHGVFGNLARARDLAERLLQIAERERRPDLLSIAWYSIGYDHFYRSEIPEAASALERAYDLAPPDDDSYRMRTGADLRVLALSYGSHAFMYLGQLDRARQWGEQAIALAHELGSPVSVAFASTFRVAQAYILHDLETLRRVLREVYAFAAELDLSHWMASLSLFAVWLELQAPEGALPMEFDDVENVQRVIAEMGGGLSPFFFCLYAEILILRRRLADAWRTLDEAMRLARERELPSWVDGIYHLQGKILLHAQGLGGPWAGGGDAEAERLFQRSIEEARRRGSRLLELRAALSLGSLWRSLGRAEDAHELVARASRGFTGDCLYLREARAFLESCLLT